MGRLLITLVAAGACLLAAGCADTGELDELRVENERLRQQVEGLLAQTPAATPTAPAAPTETATPAPVETDTATASPVATESGEPQPGQFSIADHWLTHNIIGTPEVHVTILNESDEEIDAFDVQICAFDAYGDPVSDFGLGSHCFKGVASNTRVAPGSMSTSYWTMFGRDTTRSVEITPVRSHTSQGSTWVR